MVLSSFARNNYRCTINVGPDHPIIYPKLKTLLELPYLTLIHKHVWLPLAKFGPSKALVIQAYRLFAL